MRGSGGAIWLKCGAYIAKIWEKNGGVCCGCLGVVFTLALTALCTCVTPLYGDHGCGGEFRYLLKYC